MTAHWDTCQGMSGPFMVARVNGHGLMVSIRKDRTYRVTVDRDVLPEVYTSTAEAKAAAESAAQFAPAR